MSDPILDSMFEADAFDTDKPQFDEEYGKGKWPEAILREVISQAASSYGHSVMLKVDLKGDEGMAFTFFAEAPSRPEENGSPDTYENDQWIYNVRLNQLKSLVHATGTWVEFNEKGRVVNTLWPATFRDFSTEVAYDKLVSTFRQLIGNKLPIKVDYRKSNTTDKLYKSVWGMTPKIS